MTTQNENTTQVVYGISDALIAEKMKSEGKRYEVKQRVDIDISKMSEEDRKKFVELFGVGRTVCLYEKEYRKAEIMKRNDDGTVNQLFDIFLTQENILSETEKLIAGWQKEIDEEKAAAQRRKDEQAEYLRLLESEGKKAEINFDLSEGWEKDRGKSVSESVAEDIRRVLERKAKEKAEKDAEAEKEAKIAAEKEKRSVWIQKFGSQRLKDLDAEPTEYSGVKTLYREEYIQKALDDAGMDVSFVADTRDRFEIDDRSMPSPEAISFMKKIRAIRDDELCGEDDGDVVWVTSQGENQEWGDKEFEKYEAVRIRILGKDVFFTDY